MSTDETLCPNPNETAFDCAFLGRCPCNALLADPDIGGLGVILTAIASVLTAKVLIAFVATAGLTLLLSAFALIIDVLGRRNDRNGTDGIFADTSKRQFWRKIVERVVLGLSDQQLVTGTAILSVGLYRVPPSHGHISFYHFSILADLA